MRTSVRALIVAVALLPGSVYGQAAESSWAVAQTGRLTAVYLRQSTIRGGDAITGTGWWLGQLQRQNRRFLVKLDGMVAFDPIVQGRCGYPRLLGTHTTCATQSLEDHTHTHPLLMDLGGALRTSVRGMGVGLQLGLAGEPGFGPPSYMHRNSASDDPIVPLTHNSFSAQHTVHGLVRGRIEANALRLEATAFNGAPLDDNPYDLDLGSLHSFAARVSYRFANRFEAQVSAASRQPILDHGGFALERSELYSATLQAAFGQPGNSFDLTIGIAGERAEYSTHSGLVEWRVERGSHSLTARAELVQQIEYEGPAATGGEHGHSTSGPLIPHRLGTSEVAGAYVFWLPETLGVRPGVGIRASTLAIPELLRSRYNAERATTIAIITTIRPLGPRQHQH